MDIEEGREIVENCLRSLCILEDTLVITCTWEYFNNYVDNLINLREGEPWQAYTGLMKPFM